MDLAKPRADGHPAVALAARRVLERMADDDSLSVRQTVQAALSESERVAARPPAAAAPAPRPRQQPRTETGKGSRKQSVQLRSVYARRRVVLSIALVIAGIVVGFSSLGIV